MGMRSDFYEWLKAFHYYCGKLACDDAKDLHRTGRRFPEIANVLKKMQARNE